MVNRLLIVPETQTATLSNNFPIFAPAFGNEQCTMNNEQLRTQILTYRPTSPVAAPPAATYSLFPVTYSLNYSFSAKERDTETGLSYFGARYYSSDLSVWLSVDPMSDKYPSLSPYVYCADNPVRLVDPNGEDLDDPPSKGKRLISAGGDIVIGAATATTGLALGVTTSETGVGPVAGYTLFMAGGYQLVKGVQTAFNVIVGGTPDGDSKYSTPVGDITDNTIADDLTSLCLGIGGGKIAKPSLIKNNAKTLVNINKISDGVTMAKTAKDVKKALQNSLKSNATAPNANHNKPTPNCNDFKTTIEFLMKDICH